MNTKIFLVTFISALFGTILGIFNYFFGPTLPLLYSIVIFAIPGLLIGVWIDGQRLIAWAGSSYGFFSSLSFWIIFGFTHPAIGFDSLSLIFSLQGILGGILIIYIGNFLKNKITLLLNFIKINRN